MAKNLDEPKCSWAENVENDSNTLIKKKGSAESRCSNDDSSVIEESKDDHNDPNISTEKQKVEKYDKGDIESVSEEEDVDFHSEEKGDESDWKEELHLREELIKLALEEDAQSVTMEEVLQELSQDMRADSKWLFKISSQLAVEAVVMKRRSDQLKTLEIQKREGSQSGPLLFVEETPQAVDASHTEEELKPKKDPLKCFYCYEEITRIHKNQKMNKNTKKKKSSTVATTDINQKKICFKCGLEGHIAHNCKTKESRKRPMDGEDLNKVSKRKREIEGPDIKGIRREPHSEAVGKQLEEELMKLQSILGHTGKAFQQLANCARNAYQTVTLGLVIAKAKNDTAKSQAQRVDWNEVAQRIFAAVADLGVLQCSMEPKINFLQTGNRMRFVYDTLIRLNLVPSEIPQKDFLSGSGSSKEANEQSRSIAETQRMHDNDNVEKLIKQERHASEEKIIKQERYTPEKEVTTKRKLIEDTKEKSQGRRKKKNTVVLVPKDKTLAPSKKPVRKRCRFCRKRGHIMKECEVRRSYLSQRKEVIKEPKTR